jgi:hypothetical protein
MRDTLPERVKDSSEGEVELSQDNNSRTEIIIRKYFIETPLGRLATEYTENTEKNIFKRLIF